MYRDVVCSVSLIEFNLLALTDEVCKLNGSRYAAYCSVLRNIKQLFLDIGKEKLLTAIEARGSLCPLYNERVKRQYDTKSTISAIERILCLKGVPEKMMKIVFEESGFSEIYRDGYMVQYVIWYEFYCCIMGIGNC